MMAILFFFTSVNYKVGDQPLTIGKLQYYLNINFREATAGVGNTSNFSVWHLFGHCENWEACLGWPYTLSCSSYVELFLCILFLCRTIWHECSVGCKENRYWDQLSYGDRANFLQQLALSSLTSNFVYLYVFACICVHLPGCMSAMLRGWEEAVQCVLCYQNARSELTAPSVQQP